MKELTITYPCYPEGGINFTEALTQFRFGLNEVIILGESGQQLRIRAKLDSDSPFLSVEDQEKPAFHLHAEAYPTPKGHEAWFDIRTKLADARNPKLSPQKHPDMHAKAFITTSLALFSYLGHPVTQCKCSWSDWSDNYAQFEQSYNKTNDPKQAALATWSGKIFSQLGYTNVVFIDLPSDYMAFARPTIRVVFRK